MIEQGSEALALQVCDVCNGSGITGNKVHFFSNDNTLMKAMPDEHGWVTCPNCLIRFKLTDKRRWTGLRHKPCGQKIKLTNAFS